MLIIVCWARADPSIKGVVRKVSLASLLLPSVAIVLSGASIALNMNTIPQGHSQGLPETELGKRLDDLTIDVGCPELVTIQILTYILG